jgi:hypothetical protein
MEGDPGRGAFPTHRKTNLGQRRRETLELIGGVVCEYASLESAQECSKQLLCA